MDHLTVAEAISTLVPVLKRGKLNAFVGSGISARPPSNLPTWSVLVENFVEFFEQFVEDQAKPESEYSHLRKLADEANAARKGTEDLIKIVTTLKDALIEFDEHHHAGLNGQFSAWLQGKLYHASFNELHSLIVRTNFPYILTTNYDILLENAQTAAGISRKKLTQATYLEPERLARAVHEQVSAIVYVHGRTDDIKIGEFVFTARDYAKMINRAHPGFALILRALFLTQSTVFLGYGGADPHIESILDELSLNLGYSNMPGLPQQYEVIFGREASSIQRRYKRMKRTRLILVENDDEYVHFLSSLQSAVPRG